VVEKVHELSLLSTAMRARLEDGLPAEFLEKRLPQLRRHLEHAMKKYARQRSSPTPGPS